jgi:hypothetical protein
MRLPQEPDTKCVLHPPLQSYLRAKPTRWRLIAKQRHKFKDNIKMGVTGCCEVEGFVGVRWIKDTARWQGFPKNRR